MALIQHFAYGSNMFTAWLRARCPSATHRWIASASNWTLMFSKISKDGSAKATISKAEGDRMFGVVFDLEESESPNLDVVEGAGKGYDRIDDFQVHVAGSPKPFSVVAYIADAAFIDLTLKPYDRYWKLIVAGARQHVLTTRYIKAIEATPSIDVSR